MTARFIKTISALVLFFFGFSSVGVFLGCGAACGREIRVSGSFPTVKMHHQILFRNGEREHIFDGYMLLSSRGFVVKAFAGPGIDLFTVVHAGEKSGARLHLAQLKSRIDIRAVSADIARIYAKPCANQGSKDEVSCIIRGEKVVEKYDRFGRVMIRRVPDAHDVGLIIRYSDYRPHFGREYAHRVQLKWGKGRVEMTIVLGRIEVAENFDVGLLQTTLDGL